MRFSDIKTSLSRITHDTYVRSIKTVQSMIGINDPDIFRADLFSESGMAAKIDHLLLEAGYEMSTRCNMLTAVSKFVGIVSPSKKLTEYRDIINRYDIELKEHTAKRKAADDHDIVAIHRTLEKIASSDKGVLPGVRVLASLLRYGNHDMITKIKLSTIPQTYTTDDQTNHFLDVSNKVWHLRKNGVSIKQISVPDAFFVPISDLLETYDCLATVSGVCYPDAQAGGQSISNAFSKMMGMTYTAVKIACEKHTSVILSHPVPPTVDPVVPSVSPVATTVPDVPQVPDAPTAVPVVPATPAKKTPIIVKVSHLTPVENKPKPKPIIVAKATKSDKPQLKKVVVVKTIKSEKSEDKTPVLKGYDWSYFDKEKSDKIHIRLVKNVMGEMFGKSDIFHTDLIDSNDGLDTFRAHILQLDSIHTRCNICNAMCKLLEQIAAKQYINFTIFRDECCLERKKIIKPCTDFETILPKLIEVYQNVNEHKAVRIMCLLIIESHLDKETETGVLRPSDLLSTTFSDDGEHNYIDINEHMLHIKGKYTKNGDERSLRLSDGFIQGIQKIYGNMLPLTVLCQDNLRPYKDTSSISRYFKKSVGYKFDDVRASYLAFRRKSIETPEELHELCRREGHSVRTALEYYDDRNV
jgi:hypothetical protein